MVLQTKVSRCFLNISYDPRGGLHPQYQKGDEMYLATRTATFFSLLFFLVFGGYFSLVKSCAFQLYCADFQVKELLFGLSLIGLSAVALYNFRARELLSTGIFCLLILYMITIFYLMRFNMEASMTLYDAIPLLGAFSVFYFVITSARSKFN